MRCLERMLRRADLPFRSSAGFHPAPRIVLALSLPLGVAGLNEVVELEFTAPCDPAETLERLTRESPAGLAFHRADTVPIRATATPRRAVYHVDLPPTRRAEVEERGRDLMGLSKLWVDRLRPSPKRLNIRPYIRELSLREGGLTLDLWVTSTGSARAEELLRLLGIDDLLESGSVLERTWIALRDEPDDASGSPPDGPADTLPLAVAATSARRRDTELQSATAHWGASPAGPVVE
jgi:radical SAM-linked protein